MDEAGFVIVLAALVVMVALPLMWLIGTYNRLVRLRQHIAESWSGIDVELKRRHDLIPNLVETVKGYAAHEREVLERLVELRNRAVADQDAGRMRQLGEDETQVQRQLRTLFAVAENYPDLKADQHFLELQRELALTEDRLAAARRFYNGNVREMNQLVQSFPSNLVASPMGFRTAEYFELASDAERVAPRVGNLAAPAA